MDRWESSIEDFQRCHTLDSFGSVLYTAESILKEDLAPFELDWFVQTLLSEPVCLLAHVSARLSDDAWLKVVKDAYKLLSDLVDNHYDGVQQHIDDIISQCQKPHDGRTRSHALQCLTSCVKRALPGAIASQYTAELGQASTCKAPLAILVGTICEFHPEAVADQINTIWRIYLNLLASNKNSDQVCKALLIGVWGLFKHFGGDIPVSELNEFYNKLTREYLRKCESAVLPILRDYAALFKERLSEDEPLRRELWTFDDLTPLLPVYEEAGSVLTKEQLQIIAHKEIFPRTSESHYKLKFSALRVCMVLHWRYGVCVDSVLNVDVYSLEFQLRKEVPYDVAEAVSWSIESDMVNSEKLLQTAIMFYHHLPANRRKDIVANGLLSAPPDIMHATLNFLVKETCRNDDSFITYLSLWRDIFNSQLIDKKRALFEKYIDYVLLVIENFLEEASDDKKIPDKLASLLTLTSHVLTLQPEEDYTSDQCALVSSKLVELAQQCGLEACIVAVARSATPHVDDDDGLKKIYGMIQIDKCKDEAMLCESCLALIQAKGNSTDPNVILKALEVIFSRRDAEPKTLSLAVQKLEKLIVNNNLKNDSVSKSIRLIQNLRSRKDMVGKDARVLQRDITIFLGKYLNLDSASESVDTEDNTLIVRLKDVLSLDVQNPIEGTTYKINLNRLLHLAIISEHEESLRMLLNIICASLCNNNSPLLQAALGRGIVSLCRATVGSTRPDVARHAAAFCDVDATLYILQKISEVKSPAVRRMLAETIESVLLKDPGSEANERILKAVYDEVCTMMNSNSSVIKLGGLDITESLLTALKVNRLQTKHMLPNLLILVSKTREQDSHTVFETASELFIQNIGLFSASALDSTIAELLKILLDPGQEIKRTKAKVYKNTLMSTLRFARSVMNDCSKITCIIMDIHAISDSVKFVYLWSIIPKFFDLKDDEVKEILDFENGLVLNRVFNEMDVVENMFALEAHLEFINQYASVLLKFHSAATLKYISGIIEKLPPKYVRSHRRHLSECLTHCRQICQYTPDLILKSFESWSESLPIKNITEYIEKEKFIAEHALAANALNIMLNIFRLKDPTSILTTVSIFAKTWTRIILKIYANGHIKYLKKEVPFLTDLLSVSLRFLTVTDVKNILLEGHSLEGAVNDNLGVDFGRFFMPVFINYLVKKPYLMLHDGMESCWVLINDIIKWCVRKRWHDDQLENVLELVDMIWPIYEPKASFKAKHALLLDLSLLNVKLPPESRPMRWVTAVVGSNEAKRDDRIALVPVLPGGEEYSETYRRFASLLPTRLSDMDGASRAALRALLDALAGGADKALLDIVITLADGDETAGWWDEALASCMASLASLPSLSLALLASLHARCRSASAAVCQRLLVPLLRCTPSSLCERFFASILKETLESLSSGIRAPSLHPDYSACVQQKTITLDILQVLFEKVPPSKIESPSSPLYEFIKTDKPWYLAREVIRLCFKLRDKLIAPDGATIALSRVCREFQYSAYKCMCACVCMRRPEAKIYSTVFNVGVWTKIVDESVVCELPLKCEWNRHKIRQTVSIPVTGGGRRVRGSTRSRSSSRTRVFLRTLSENPLEYDLIDHLDDDIDTQDVELADSSLNNHPCSATLTALVQHAAALDHHEWRSVLCEALVKGRRNLRWLLAEAVCNSKEELKSHATYLRPALLAVTADTAQEGCNSLHIDTLNTLIHWGGDVTNSEVPLLNSAINCLVHTALKNSTRTNIFKMLEDVLENLFMIYGRHIEGDLKIIENYFDDPTRTKASLKILLRFAKNKVHIPDLLPWLLTKLSDNHRVYKKEMSILAEVIGAEMSNSSEQAKITAAAKLKKILEEIRRRSVSDYVKIVHCSGCCDEQQFRVIVDLTQKLPEADRKKCLRIISTYIWEHPDAPEAAEVPANIRQMADQISVDRQFEDLFITEPQFLMPSHPAKRVKAEISSPILKTIGRNEKYISEVLTRLGRGKDQMRRVDEKLSKTNMAVRFVECFYIAIYLPIKYTCDNTDLSVCMSAFFNMLFSHLKTLDNFKDKRLRDEPWTVANPIGVSRSRSKRMVGTLRSIPYNTSIRDIDYNETEQGIDVQVTIEKILDIFVQFAKVTPEAAMELLTQLLGCLVGRGFDPRSELSQLLSTLLTKAPELVVLARGCVDQLCFIDGFTQTLGELKKSTLGSDGEQLFRLLSEETRVRCGGPHLFELGSLHKDEEDISMMEDATFSIEGLVSAFQKLSNWDEFTCQERRRVEDSLPALWTDKESSQELLDEYTDTNGWFGEMVQLYCGNRKDLMKWLRCIDKWPRRHYVAASVIEAMQWHDVDIDVDTLQLPCDIQRRDCLAEWAARLMLRTAYLSQRYGMESAKLSRSHELLWCGSANERGLHRLALSVIKRNHLDLEEDETLVWLEQKMLASTMMGLKRNDSSELEKALQTAEYLPDFYEHSTPEVIIGVNKLIMRLNYKLESLSSSKIDDIMHLVEEQVSRLSKREVTAAKNRKNLADLYETSILYYDGMWEENELSRDEILVKMSAYLGRMFDQNAPCAGVAAMLLNRLDQCDVISDKAAAALLAKIKPILSDLPSCYVEQLRSKISLFPTQVIRSCGIAELQGEAELDQYRQRLQLLCHADYLLMQYCEELYTALQSNDTSKWDKIFNRMKSRIFENEFSGTDYQALTKYESTFNTIRAADPEMKRVVLKGILHDLKSLPVRETIRLSHVCPSLAEIDEDSSGLERLLRLPADVLVVKIEEELRVFSDSVRRPCVLTLVTSDGRRRRYLHKNEDLRADAAVTNLTTSGLGYAVIPLSEDCGLIEFLEDHKRIRDLIASTCNIDEIQIVRQAVKDDELVLAPRASSVQNYSEICNKIPAYALRSAIERLSSSVQDFIHKKRRFQETLSDMTIINWLFGLGDRHLQNLLYSIQDGGVQCIDWGAILQYGGAELPPARLTRNMLAVCDTAVLESQLQSKLSSLRDSHQLIVPVLKLSFKWMEDFYEKLTYIEGILQGRMVSQAITKNIIQKSSKPHKAKYIQLLDTVFDKYLLKDVHTAEEQVSCLLLQCTDPWILSVTRSGWEPWL